jgi:hypothetical protein
MGTHGFLQATAHGGQEPAASCLIIYNPFNSSSVSRHSKKILQIALDFWQGAVYIPTTLALSGFEC